MGRKQNTFHSFFHIYSVHSVSYSWEIKGILVWQSTIVKLFEVLSESWEIRVGLISTFHQAHASPFLTIPQSLLSTNFSQQIVILLTPEHSENVRRGSLLPAILQPISPIGHLTMGIEISTVEYYWSRHHAGYQYLQGKGFVPWTRIMKAWVHFKESRSSQLKKGRRYCEGLFVLPSTSIGHWSTRKKDALYFDPCVWWAKQGHREDTPYNPPRETALMSFCSEY